jgi:hypothetical protein
VHQGTLSSARLMALDAGDVNGTAPDAPGPYGLYNLFWQFRGDECVVRPDVFGDAGQPAASALLGRRRTGGAPYVGMLIGCHTSWV